MVISGSLVVLVLVTIALVAASFITESEGFEEQRKDLTRELRRRGLEVVDLQIQRRGSNTNRHYTFQVEVRRKGASGTYSGRGELSRGVLTPVVHWNSVDPTTIRALGAEEEPAAPPRPPPSGEDDDRGGTTW